jgi:hypothetical protein
MIGVRELLPSWFPRACLLQWMGNPRALVSTTASLRHSGFGAREQCKAPLQVLHMEQQMCVIACSIMGDTLALLFAVLATAWGLYQRRAKVRTDQNVTTLEAEKSKLEAEIKVLSFRPPAMPAFLIQAAPITNAQSTSTPPPAHHEGEPYPDETLG